MLNKGMGLFAFVCSACVWLTTYILSVDCLIILLQLHHIEKVQYRLHIA